MRTNKNKGKNQIHNFSIFLALVFFGALFFASNAQAACTFVSGEVCTEPGTHTFTVPGGISSMTVEIDGAGGTSGYNGELGWGGAGGRGGKIKVEFPSASGTYTVKVGGASTDMLIPSGASYIYKDTAYAAAGAGGNGGGAGTCEDPECFGDTYSGDTGANGESYNLALGGTGGFGSYSDGQPGGDGSNYATNGLNVLLNQTGGGSLANANGSVTITYNSGPGVCGTNSGTAATLSALNLCSNGTPSAVSGTGLVNWTCTGSDVVSCSAEVATYQISTNTPANGSISCSPTIVNGGTASVCTISPNANYTLSELADNGASVFGSVSGNSYTISSITADHNLIATFSPNYNISASVVGGNGTISPASHSGIIPGETRAFTVSPAAGFVANMGGTCSGTLVGNTYTTSASNNANCTVIATFVANTATFTSEIKNFTDNDTPTYGNISWTQGYAGTSADSTSVKMRVRTGTTPDGSGSSWAAWSDLCEVVNGGSADERIGGGDNSCVDDGEKYVQYQAILSTTGTNVPTLSSVTISTEPTFQPGWLISSPFNTTNAYGTVQDIKWTADTGTAGSKGSVKFQIRSKAEGGSWGTWCGPDPDGEETGETGCAATAGDNNFAGTYYTLAAGENPINVANSTPLNKNSQYFQYAAFLDPGQGGTQAPTLQSVTASYAFNTPAIVATNISTFENDANGIVTVPYTITETLDSFGKVAHGTSLNGERGTTDSPIKTLLFYQPNLDAAAENAVTLPDGGIDNGTVNGNGTTFTLKNAGNATPSAGYMLVEGELIKFTAVGNVITIVARGVSFDDPSGTTFYTKKVAHSGNNIPVFFKATPAMQEVNDLCNATVGAITASNPCAPVSSSKSFSWDPRSDSSLNLNGKKLTNVILKVVANDADATEVNNLGGIDAPSAAYQLDLEGPKVVSVTTDLSTLDEPEKTFGIFGIGKSIFVKVTFDEPVTTVGDVEVKFNMGANQATCIVNISGAAVDNYTCPIQVNIGDLSSDLSLIGGAPILGTIKDEHSNITANPAAPVKTDLHDSPDIRVDGVKPIVGDPTFDNVVFSPGVSESSKDETVISYSLDEDETKVTIKIFDDQNAEIKAFAEQTKNSGTNTQTWDGKNNANATVSEGVYTVKITAIDSAGNAADEKTGTVTVDKTAPEISDASVDNVKFSPNPENGIKDEAKISYTLSENVDNVAVKIYDGETPVRTLSDGASSTAGAKEIAWNGKDASSNFVADKNYTYKLDATDAAGNNATQQTGTITVDNTAPRLTNVAASPSTGYFKQGAPITVDFTFSEAVSLSNVNATFDSGGTCALSAATPTTATCTYTVGAAENSSDLTISSFGGTLTDEAGNDMSDFSPQTNLAANASIVIDTIGQAININSPAAGAHTNSNEVSFMPLEALGSGLITFTPQSGEPVTKTFGVLVANVEHSEVVDGLLDGTTYTLRITGKDLAENDMVSMENTGIVYDTTAPTVSVAVSDFFNDYDDQSDISFSFGNNSETLQSATLTFADNANVLPVAVCQLKQTSLGDGNHANVNLSSECVDQITLVDGTLYNISLQATDLAGNSTTETINSKTFDITAPVLQYFKSTSLNSTVENPTAAGNVNITAVYSEPVTAGNLNVKVGPMNAQVNVTLNANGNNDELGGEFAIGLPRTGYDTTPDYLKVENIIENSESVTDRAGNIRTNTSIAISDEQNLAAHGSTIVIDTTPPILQSFTIEGNSGKTSFNQNDSFTLVANYNKTIQAGGDVRVILNTGSGAHEINLTNVSNSRKLSALYEVDPNENAQDLKVEEVLSQNAVDGKGVPLATVGKVTDGQYAQNAGDPVENLSNFRIDTFAPTLGATPISIQNNNGKTSDVTPAITLDASDNFDFSDGKVYYQMSGSSWCGPITYRTNINSNDDADLDITSGSCGGNANTGSKNVSVKFVDTAGNESAVASAMVELDIEEPVLGGFTTETATGIYGTGVLIKIVATYNEPLSSGTMTVLLNNGKQVTLSTVENSNQLTTGNNPYVIGSTGSGESIGALKIVKILSQSVSDTSNPANVQMLTTENYEGTNLDSDGKNISIDTDAPTATAPDGSIIVDRYTEDGKIKVMIDPDDGGVDLDGMSAKIKILGADTACNLTGASNETFTQFPQTFTYDDTTDVIRKVCLQLTDQRGNISNTFEAKTPNTPQDFTYTDLTNETLTGAILTWNKPTEEGSGMFSKYDLLSCESGDGNDCAPNESHEITNINENYKVFNSGLSKSKKYCYKVIFKDLFGNISKSSQTECKVPGEGPVLADTDVDFLAVPFVANVTKSSANVVFETINKNDQNKPLATTAKVEVFESEDLSAPIKTVDAGLNVTHSVAITNLEKQSTKYYLKITVTDSSNKSKILSYGLAVTESTNPILAFTTLGALSAIEEIKESLITDVKAVITFKTNQEAKCFIDFKDSTISTYNDFSADIEKDYTSNHSIILTQLIAKTNYDYKVTCSDKDGTILTSPEHHFATLEKGLTQGEIDASGDKNAPEISSISLTNITGENATITWTTNEVASSLLAYELEGTDYMLMSGDYLVNSDKDKYATIHTVQLKGLLPASKYSFTALSTDASGNIGQSAVSTFTTREPSSLSSVKVLSKALGQATITWETGSATSSQVEYGLTTSYGNKKEDSSKVKEHSVTLTDLTPGETYHFRVKGEDDQKNIYASSDMTFQPKAPPKISDFKIDSITEHGAVITFNTNVSTNAIVSYENTEKSEDSGFQGRPDFVSKHEIKLKDLSSGATFSVKLKVRDEDGNETEETFPNFTTAKDEAAPKIDRVKTDAALTQTDKVQAIISWSTDELSTGEIIYKEGKNGEEKKFEVNSAPAFSHIGVITSFKSGVVYYFKVRSADAAGNMVTSTDYALLTPKQRQNIIQVIIGNFTDIFGWAKF